VTAYLTENNCNAFWLDARKVVKTDHTYQEGRVKWDETQKSFDKLVKSLYATYDFFITQGFIGQTDEGMTTTLGREGSDFTASIYAFVSKAESVTIWKDVPGMLNADPRYFSGTVLLKKISFTEAVELAYYGASVIHPKTIQPLKNSDIPLYIKSFIHPENEGTVIQSSTKYDAAVPSYIFKENQILISLTPKDFSFVVEDQLTEIFALLSNQKIRLNLMQNSAVSFSFLIDDKYKLGQLLKNLGKKYKVKYNENLSLLTIRHFDDKIIERLTGNKTILLTQKTRETARIILK
jgi:aspartate kinase